MSLFADNNGKEQFIEYRYDENRRIYIVTGIFNRIHMKADAGDADHHQPAQRLSRAAGLVDHGSKY